MGGWVGGLVDVPLLGTKMGQYLGVRLQITVIFLDVLLIVSFM